MKMLLVGVALTLVVQLLLIGGYLGASDQDPIILDPNRGGIVENGIAMAAYCGPHSGKEMLDELPAIGEWDTWTKGQTVLLSEASCNIWYHHHEGYSPCGHPGYIFERPCPESKRGGWVGGD